MDFFLSSKFKNKSCQMLLMLKLEVSRLDLEGFLAIV